MKMVKFSTSIIGILRGSPRTRRGEKGVKEGGVSVGGSLALYERTERWGRKMSCCKVLTSLWYRSQLDTSLLFHTCWLCCWKEHSSLWESLKPENDDNMCVALRNISQHSAGWSLILITIIIVIFVIMMRGSYRNFPVCWGVFYTRCPAYKCISSQPGE